MLPPDIENYILEIYYIAVYKEKYGYVLEELHKLIDDTNRCNGCHYGYADEDEDISCRDLVYHLRYLFRLKKRVFFSIKTFDVVLKDLKSYFWSKNNPFARNSLICLATYDEVEKYMYGGSEIGQEQTRKKEQKTTLTNNFVETVKKLTNNVPLKTIMKYHIPKLTKNNKNNKKKYRRINQPR